MVDKYEAKKYVAERIGEEFVIPTYGVWDLFDDIDFDSLPNQFVLKCTHDSGGVVICKDKSSLNLSAAKKKLESSLKRNYFWAGREWPYKSVRPRIIAEKYMTDSETADLRDYKFFCFNGVVKCYKIDFDRFVEHHANYFTPDGKLLDIGEKKFPPLKEKDLKIPENIDQMIKLGEDLAGELPFLRVDFYDVDGKIYFGELTFFPASGFGEFISEDNNNLLGEWIKLPDKFEESKQ